jgi:hypothetical protein
MEHFVPRYSALARIFHKLTAETQRAQRKHFVMESADRLFPDPPWIEDVPKSHAFSTLCVLCASAVNNSG